MATIRYEPRSGNWEALIRRKGYPTQTATFSMRRQAEDWAKTVEADMIWRRFIDQSEAERTTLGQALDRYGREVTPRKRGHSQKEHYIAAALRKHDLALRPLAHVRGPTLVA